MLKNIVRICCAMLLVSVLAGCNEKPASVAVVDLTAVQTQSKLMIKVSEHLEAFRGKLMAQALEAENAFKANETDETREAYLAAVDSFEAAAQEEEKRIFTALSEGIEKILADYRAANNISVILIKDTVLSFDQALDVTEAVTAELDKLELDFDGAQAASEPEPAEQKSE